MSDNIHYYIDAYNILFRFSDPSENLKSSRDLLINEINAKLELVPLNVSLVFDAFFALGDSSRSHMPNLEILFTSHGETADQFIVDALKSHSSFQEVVVTSDKGLTALVRALGAKTQTVDGFLSWLNRRYKKKLLELKQQPGGVRKSKKGLQTAVSSEKIEESPLVSVPIQGSLEHYAQVFEARFQELSQEEASPSKAQPRKHKQKTLKFHPEKKINEFERWLKLFEETNGQE